MKRSFTVKHFLKKTAHKVIELRLSHSGVVRFAICCQDMPRHLESTHKTYPLLEELLPGLELKFATLRAFLAHLACRAN